MYTDIDIAGIILRLEARRELRISPELIPFLAAASAEPDVTVRISWNWEEADVLRTEPIGRDRILIYFREGGYCYCWLDGGDRGPVAQTRYTPDFSEIRCTINTAEFDVPQDHVRQILRMLPIRQLLLSRGVLFLHASQVRWQDRGILFSAPSGTGKTTQARLWQQYRNAEIICNDRTLLRNNGRQWMTCGYPYDGSEPVGSNSSQPLGCIVLLEQAAENQLVRLGPAKAMARLMRQLVIDAWDPGSRLKAMELIAALLEHTPVYALRCTISEEAVALLEEAMLKEDLNHGKGI